MAMLSYWGPSPARAQEPQTVVVPPNAEFTITVSDNPTTGYTLALKSMSEGVFFLFTDALQSPARPIPGAGSSRTFHFYNSLAAGAGEAEVVFARFQRFNFQDSYVEERYTLDIRERSADPPSRLGITGQNDSRGGVRVSSVVAGSLAEKLGLRPGDRVTELNGDQITQLGDIATALAKTIDKVDATAARGGSVVPLSVPWP
jgi:predicted secreted protein